MHTEKIPIPSLHDLNSRIASCSKCARLVEFRESVLENSPRYREEEFWRKGVPGYGDFNGRMMIVGLAPAASGANRTGRVFTGDKSSEILSTALYRNGLSNKPSSESKDDGLEYIDMYLTLAVRCVPPDNLPSREEKLNCLPYLEWEIVNMKDLRAIVALGTVAFEAIKSIMKFRGFGTRNMRFIHGSYAQFGDLRVYCCYHPSPRNINTGRTSLEDIASVIGKAHDYAIS